MIDNVKNFEVIKTNINKELKDFSKKVSDILGNNFIGFYIFGSFTTGTWNPDTSDIDFLVIIKNPLNSEEIEQLKELHRNIITTESGAKLEGEYADLDMLQKRKFSNVCGRVEEGKFSNGPSKVSTDNLAAILESGQVIQGENIESLSIEVTIEELRESVLRLLHEDYEKIEATNDLKDLNNILIDILRCIYTLNNEKLPTKQNAIIDNKDLISVELYENINKYLKEKIEFKINKEKIKKLAEYGFSLK